MAFTMKGPFTWFKALSGAWKIIVVCTPLVIALWLGYGLLRLDRPIEKWGVFGDKFGALNTLFTGLAMVGLLATLKHQHDENIASKRDHQELIEAHNANTQALNNQIEVQRAANYLNALVARIDGYSHQQALYLSGSGKPPPKLVDEQDVLMWELAISLEQARAVAGFKDNADARKNAERSRKV